MEGEEEMKEGREEGGRKGGREEAGSQEERGE